MSVIYHITTRSFWEDACKTGIYAPDTLRSDGSIQCLSADQYVDVANMWHAGQPDLVLLFIDTDHLLSELRYEATDPATPASPRLFGPLNLEAVFEVAEYEPGPSGKFEEHHETPGFSVRGDADLGAVRTRAWEAMASFDRPWWIAGGWVIDVFLGRKTRPHADLEISILSSDQRALFEHLQGWDLRLAAPQGSFPRWDGHLLSEPYHQVWARQDTHPASTPRDFSMDPTMLDLLIEDSDGDVWRYRRHGDVIRPIAEFGDRREGLPFVRPEIALLFKAKGTRYKDQRDLERVLPGLDEHARTWLRTALGVAHPDHRWCHVL